MELRSRGLEMNQIFFLIVQLTSMNCQWLLNPVPIAVLSLFPTLTCLGQNANQIVPGSPPLITKGPYVQAASANTFMVMWESLTNLTGTVRYGTGKRLDQTVPVSSPRKMIG